MLVSAQRLLRVQPALLTTVLDRLATADQLLRAGLKALEDARPSHDEWTGRPAELFAQRYIRLSDAARALRGSHWVAKGSLVQYRQQLTAVQLELRWWLAQWLSATGPAARELAVERLGEALAKHREAAGTLPRDLGFEMARLRPKLQRIRLDPPVIYYAGGS